MFHLSLLVSLQPTTPTSYSISLSGRYWCCETKGCNPAGDPCGHQHVSTPWNFCFSFCFLKQCRVLQGGYSERVLSLQVKRLNIRKCWNQVCLCTLNSDSVCIYTLLVFNYMITWYFFPTRTRPNSVHRMKQPVCSEGGYASFIPEVRRCEENDVGLQDETEWSSG